MIRLTRLLLEEKQIPALFACSFETTIVVRVHISGAVFRESILLAIRVFLILVQSLFQKRVSKRSLFLAARRLRNCASWGHTHGGIRK